MLCAECDAPLCRENRSGLCRACCARHNGHASRHKMAATMRRKIAADPAYKQRIRDQLANYSRTAEARDAARQRLLDRPIFLLGQAGAGGPGAPARIKAGQSHTNRRLAWCPPEYRDLYRTLLSKSLGAEKAQQMTLAQHRADMKKFRKSLGVA